MKSIILRLLVGLICVPASGWCESVPILRFHEVSPGIYRGARPDLIGLQSLRALGVKTIIDLEDNSSAIREESKGAASNSLQFISEPMSGFWAPSDPVVNQTLRLLSDPSNYPVFLHCQHGEDRTGLIIGLYRVLFENWSPAAAYGEMKELGFHPLLFPLNHYFETKTGYED